jgi:ABC-type transport system involved in Fe-S cluster assembly fused permease/ATPase subunit
MLDKTLTVLKDISKDRTDIEKLWSLVDDNLPIQGIENGHDFVFSQGQIVFSNISFAYNANRFIIKDFNITIES